MRVAVIASRFPFPPHSGDRLRTMLWLDALRGEEVSLVAPPGELPAGYGDVHHVVTGSHRAGLVPAAVRALAEGLPLHTAALGGSRWREAMRSLGPVDAAVVVLSRLHPWVFHELRAGRKLLDAVDAMARSMEERAGAATLTRPIWRMEQRRAARFEARVAREYDLVTVVNPEEREALGEHCVVVPNGVEIEPLGEAARLFDFAFWGNLRYFANRDALELLLGTIWPALRAARPGATLLVGGAEAPASLLRLNGTSGITVLSPMDDRPEVLRHVRVALLPLRYGSGHSNKVLEAAEAGCAIAATTVAFRGLEDMAAGQVSENEAATLARRAAALLEDDRWRVAGAVARSAAVARHDRAAVLRRLRALVTGPDGGAQV